MDLREIGINGVNWIQLAQESTMVNFCEHGDKPSGSVETAGCF